MVAFRFLRPGSQTFVSTESLDLMVPGARSPSSGSVSDRWIPSKNSSHPALFRSGRRIEEHLLSANMVIDKTLLANVPLWLLSLDLTKTELLVFTCSWFNRRSLGFLDSFTGQSPALQGSSPSPSQRSLTRGWEAAGLGGWAWGLGQELATLVSWAQSWSRRLAAKACKAT